MHPNSILPIVLVSRGDFRVFGLVSLLLHLRVGKWSFTVLDVSVCGVSLKDDRRFWFKAGRFLAYLRLDGSDRGNIISFLLLHS